MKKRIAIRIGLLVALLCIATTMALAQNEVSETRGSATNDNSLLELLEPVVIDPNESYYFDHSETLNFYMANLYVLVVDAFERAGEWRGEMPREQGLITVRRIYGAPRALAMEAEQQGRGTGPDDFGRRLGWPAPSPDGIPATVDLAESVEEETERAENSGTSLIWTPPRYKTNQGHYEYRYFDEINVPNSQMYTLAAGNADERTSMYIPNERCLGVKIEFLRRGFNEFAIFPPKPIYLEGVVKGMEIWVCGRNKRHELLAWIDDVNGNSRYISFGDLNFLGWRKLTSAVSPLIRQEDWRYTQNRGITFNGFIVRCDVEDSYGTFYMYMDNFTVLIDRYFEENRSIYDPSDMW